MMNLFESRMNLVVTKKEKSNSIFGIPNYGNTCYLNSFIQFCVHSYFFTLINDCSTSDLFVKNLKEIINLNIENLSIKKELIQKTIQNCNLQ